MKVYIVEVLVRNPVPEWEPDSEHHDEMHASMVAGEIIESGIKESEVRIRTLWG